MSAPIDDLLRHCRRLGLSADIGTMFRSPALRYEGKAFAFQGLEGGVIVKLPNDRITELADGSILVADDAADTVWRVAYTG